MTVAQVMAIQKERARLKGARVQIVYARRKQKYHKTLGVCGTIQNTNSGKEFGILLDDMWNDASSTGVWWFEECEFKILDKEESEETNMKLTGFNKVAVITQGCGGTYYYALYDEAINAGDEVLVSGTAAGKLHRIDEVISVEDIANRFSKDITAEVICKVDMSAYDKRVADRKEAEKIKNEMNRIIKQMDEVNKYEMYAKNNPELAEMLSKYKDLVG